MKLASAVEGQVVRNDRNGSYYRFERLEKGRVRIFPLELFPNGLLAAKSFATLVGGDLDVTLIGTWAEGMVLEAQPTRSRRVYENELVKLEREVLEVRDTYDHLPRNGKGKLSRGSWANKVKALDLRIAVLKAGLGFVAGSPVYTKATASVSPDFTAGCLVQVPSGRLAKILGFQSVGDSTYALCATLLGKAVIKTAIPLEVLRPRDQARRCTV